MKMVWGLLSTDISILERGLTMAKGKREKESREVTSWRPFFEMSRWEREMDRQFGDFFERRLSPFRGRHWWPSGGVGVSVPAVDLYEDKDEIVVKVELPGMEKDDIDVDLTDDWLTIKGEKRKKKRKRRRTITAVNVLTVLSAVASICQKRFRSRRPGHRLRMTS